MYELGSALGPLVIARLPSRRPVSELVKEGRRRDPGPLARHWKGPAVQLCWPSFAAFQAARLPIPHVQPSLDHSPPKSDLAAKSLTPIACLLF